MDLEIQLLNCLLLMLPIWAWNLILGPKISDPRITSDAHSQKWLLFSENALRIAIFTLPLLIPLFLGDHLRKIGLVVCIIGTLIYFASWLPLLFAVQSGWSNSIAGLLAPRITPLFVLLGIAFIGHSWLYGILSTFFIILHTVHGINNFS